MKASDQEMPASLNLLVIYCKNLGENLRFYENLGLQFVKEQHGSGPIHYSCTLNSLVLELYPASKDNTVSNCRLGFKVSERLNVSLTNRQLVVDPDGRKVDITI